MQMLLPTRADPQEALSAHAKLAPLWMRYQEPFFHRADRVQCANMAVMAEGA